MPTVTEGSLTFTFPAGWEADKPDDWNYYRQNYIKIAEKIKCIDILAIPPDEDENIWLIEVKDYRISRKVGPTELAEAIISKVQNSLGLFSATSWQKSYPSEMRFCKKAHKKKIMHVVLHMEQPRHQSRLFMQPINPASMRDLLRQKLKWITASVLVVDKTKHNTHWTVT